MADRILQETRDANGLLIGVTSLRGGMDSLFFNKVCRI